MDTVKKYLCILIMIIIGLGILGLIPSFQGLRQKPWSFNSNLFIFHPHPLGNLDKQNYALLDEDDFGVDKDDLTLGSSNIPFELFPLVHVKLLISPFINSRMGIFFDEVKSSTYNSIFALLPLRSPPIFLIPRLYT